MICKTAENQTELTDEELGDIAGGAFYIGERFDSPALVTFIAEVGQTLEVKSGMGFGTTVRCKITDRKIQKKNESGGNLVSVSQDYYVDVYYAVPLEEHFFFKAGWVARSDIEI